MRIAISTVLRLVGAALLTAGTAGCWGDTFATMTVTNECDVPVRVSAAGVWPTEEWPQRAQLLAVGDTTEVQMNAPAGQDVWVLIGADRTGLDQGARPSPQGFSDRTDLILSGTRCPE